MKTYEDYKDAVTCPTKDQIIAAAAAGGTLVDKVLRQLFPEVFAPNIVQWTERCIVLEGITYMMPVSVADPKMIEMRRCGPSAKQGLYLNPRFNWTIEDEPDGNKLLVARIRS